MDPRKQLAILEKLLLIGLGLIILLMVAVVAVLVLAAW
jgi:hypothetical protein